MKQLISTIASFSLLSSSVYAQGLPVHRLDGKKFDIASIELESTKNNAFQAEKIKQNYTKIFEKQKAITKKIMFQKYEAETTAYFDALVRHMSVLEDANNGRFIEQFNDELALKIKSDFNNLNREQKYVFKSVLLNMLNSTSSTTKKAIGVIVAAWATIVIKSTIGHFKLPESKRWTSEIGVAIVFSTLLSGLAAIMTGAVIENYKEEKLKALKKLSGELEFDLSSELDIITKEMMIK